MYKPTKKTLEQLGFVNNMLEYNKDSDSDYLYYYEGKIKACYGMDPYCHTTFTTKNLRQLKSLVEMFLYK